MIRRTLPAVLVAVLASVSLAFAGPVASRYDVGADGAVIRTTEWVVADGARSVFRHPVEKGSESAAARVSDAASGRPLAASIADTMLVVRLGPQPAEGGVRRVVIEERFGAGTYAHRTGAALVFEAELPGGRHTIILPPGYVVAAAAPAVQVLMRGGRTHAGLVVPDEARWPVRLEASALPGGPADVPTRGTFRAEDARSLVYFLEDPAAHRIDLTIDLEIDRPGQAHVYSQLRQEDGVRNPRTVDLDRGHELPTRIVNGAQANAIGDAGTTFPPDASVYVADLPEPVPPGGRRRVRLYQTATDAGSYGLDEHGELRFDRFVARLRTRVVLPEEWSLTSVDQPASVSRDERGRVVLDFLQTGGETPRLLITARRARP